MARFGTPLLYRNLGGGRFADVTAGSGLTAFANTIAVIAFDYDGDGRLDLLFGNYFRPLDLTALTTPHVLPNNLDDAVNGGGVTLWRNVTAAGGPLRFVDVTAQAGLSGTTGWTLDVGHGDFDGDGRPDLYLADDYGTDRLYLNAGPDAAGVVRFRDVTEQTIGFDTKKGMNAEIADYDRDGRLDVYVTNITDEYMRECNMLWHNDGPGADGVPTFTDVARETGTCNTLWGWAAKFGDFDDDGWLDLFAVDGLRSAGAENYIPVLLEMILTPGVDFTDLGAWPPIGTMSWSGHQRSKLFRNLGDAGVQGDGRRRRRRRRPRRARHRRRRLRRRRPPRPAGDQLGAAQPALPQRQPRRRRVDRAAAGRHPLQPRRHRRPRAGGGGRRLLGGRGERRQRLRRAELARSSTSASAPPAESMRSRCAGRAACASASPSPVDRITTLREGDGEAVH